MPYRVFDTFPKNWERTELSESNRLHRIGLGIEKNRGRGEYRNLFQSLNLFSYFKQQRSIETTYIKINYVTSICFSMEKERSFKKTTALKNTEYPFTNGGWSIHPPMPYKQLRRWGHNRLIPALSDKVHI